MRFWLLILLFICVRINAATYYFSTTDGDDSRTAAQAQNQATPWKTIAKLNSVFTSTINAGDQILFKKGDVFLGGITITKSGANGNPITFSSYSTGANPNITGFADATGWVNISSNKWQTSAAASTLTTCNMVTINGVYQKIGTFPNTGYNTINSSSGGTSLTSTSLTLNYVGGQVAIRKQHWIIDKSTITSQAGTTINFTNPSSYNIQNGWGFIILNSTTACDVQNEWWYDPATKKLGMFSVNSPVGIKLSTVETLVNAGSFSFITFNGIDFTGSNTSVFTATNANSGVQFQGCNFLNNGLNGITVQPACSNFTLNNCVIDRTMNCFINGNGSTGWTITNNTITNTAQQAGMGTSGDGTYNALNNIGANSLIQFNVVRATGYNAINFNGGGVTVNKNLVDIFNNVKDDGAGIYTFTGATTTVYSPRRTVTNNIVLNGSTAAAVGTNTTTSSAYGIYMDDNSSQVDVAGNTMANCGGSGLFLHADHDITVTGNTLYNNVLASFYAQILANYPGAVATAPVRNLVVTGNIIVSRAATQVVATYSTNETNFAQWGTFNNNYYCRPIAENSTTFAVKTTNTNLAGWQTLSGGLDANSHKSPTTITDVNNLRFEYNATNSPVVVNLGANYIDMTGASYAGSITLSAYSSSVLIFNGAAVTPKIFGIKLASNFTSQPVYRDMNGNEYSGSITLKPYSSTVLIKVSGGTNKKPISNAGPDQVIKIKST